MAKEDNIFTHKYYRLADLIDLEAVQKMATSHYKATGIPIGIIDALDNSVLVGAGWQDICLNFHRSQPQTLKLCQKSDNYIKKHLSTDNPCRYKCLNGLWDIGMPIVVMGQHLATMFLGQFFYENEIPDRTFFEKQAKKYNFNKKDYLEALDKVPVFSREKINIILEYDNALSKFIADLAQETLWRKHEEYEKESLETRLKKTEKMDAIGQLAGGIAHDFNNMLGGIIGAAEVLQILLPDRRDIKEFIQIIIDTAIRATNLTGKLLTFSRRDTKSFSSIDVHDIIHETINLLKNTLDRRIRLKLNFAAQESTVAGDSVQIQNALLNLAINASHAMPQGGEITFQTQNITLDHEDCKKSSTYLTAGKYIEIKIRDTGNGISSQNIKKIFDPFFTTKKQNQGIGLGLATVYGTIKQHKGSINVSSELNKGTTFYLLLPLTEDKKIELPHCITPRKGKGLILVVDDEKYMRTTTKAILENLGYEVLLAENGQEAVNIFDKKATEIDLVILDMVMPVMNGKDCFLALKKKDPKVQVILSSGFTKKEDLEEMKLAGLFGFIRKPYRLSLLSEMVHKAIKNKQTNS